MITTPHKTTFTTTWPQPSKTAALPSLPSWSQHRLNQLFTQTREIPFNDQTRLIFFSDLHRGDKSAADEFAPNEPLFLHALTHYYTNGYTYIEVGDGDDLWSTNRFQDIRQAYAAVFNLLHRFADHNRLHLLFGNHELGPQTQILQDKDGLPVEEALILRHTRTNQRIFVTHGHQVDFWCDRWAGFSRRFVNFLRLFSLHEDGKLMRQEKRSMLQNMVANWSTQQQEQLEQRLAAWAQHRNQVLISGHTHRPVGLHTAPYFNIGSGVEHALITGIEIQRGMLKLIRWVQTETAVYQREVLHRVPLQHWG